MRWSDAFVIRTRERTGNSRTKTRQGEQIVWDGCFAGQPLCVISTVRLVGSNLAHFLVSSNARIGSHDWNLRGGHYVDLRVVSKHPSRARSCCDSDSSPRPRNTGPSTSGNNTNAWTTRSLCLWPESAFPCDTGSMEPRPTLVTPEEIRQFDAALDSLFAPDEGHPCDECKALLMAFAAARPNDFAFVTPSDLVDPSQCAFQGMHTRMGRLYRTILRV